MSSDRTRDLVLPLAVLASVAVGALLGSLFTRAEGGATTASAASQGDSKELVEVLQALRAEIALLREARTSLSVPSSASERVEASPAGGAPKNDLVKELQAATRELAAAVETMRQTVERPGGDSNRLVFPVATLDPNRFDAFLTFDQPQMQKEHLLWSYQQVLTKLGKPDMVTSGEQGTQWIYSHEKAFVNFQFRDGLVWQVWMQKR